jgi:serine/threonine protein kinase
MRQVFDDWRHAVQIRDVQSMMRLSNHQNLVTLLEVHRTLQGDLWLVFERLETSLHDVLCNHPEPLPPRVVADWTRDALTGLHYLHEARFLHRDVKPENLLLALDGTLKVADFSLARGMHESSHELTTYVSTRWYRAPEVLLGRPYGPPSDLFAAGCVLAEMFTHDPLFPGDTDVGQLHEIVSCLGNPPGLEHFAVERSVDLSPPPRSLTEPPIKSLRRKTDGLVPPDALEVLAGILDVDPAGRWTTPQVLQHPFFSRHHQSGASKLVALDAANESPDLVGPDHGASQQAIAHGVPDLGLLSHSPANGDGGTTTSSRMSFRKNLGARQWSDVNTAQACVAHQASSGNGGESRSPASVVLRNPYSQRSTKKLKVQPHVRSV